MNFKEYLEENYNDLYFARMLGRNPTKKQVIDFFTDKFKGMDPKDSHIMKMIHQISIKYNLKPKDLLGVLKD